MIDNLFNLHARHNQFPFHCVSSIDGPWSIAAKHRSVMAAVRQKRTCDHF